MARVGRCTDAIPKQPAVNCTCRAEGSIVWGWHGTLIHMHKSQGVHCSSTVNIHVRAQKGYYLEQACTKCTYKRHIAIKQEVDIYEAGDKAIEKYM